MTADGTISWVEHEQGVRPREYSRVREGDLDLARRSARGDRAAFHVIIDRHARHLLRTARGLCRSSEDAEDLVQETLIEAYRGIGKFDGRASLLTWMSRILVNRSARRWRKSFRRAPEVPLDAALDVPQPDAGLLAASSHTRVEHRLDLAAALETLVFEHRQVLVLRELQGLSYAQIAAILGVPRGTVESRLFRARAALRERLSKGYAQ